MGSPLAPVVRGQKLQIHASTWNAVLRMLRAFQGGTGAGESLDWGGVVTAKATNSTGADLREYRPATITGVGGYELPTAESDWQRQPLFTLGVPSTSTDVVVVTLEAIPDGQTGLVAIAGAVLCDVNLGTATTTRYARPTVGSTDSLERATRGSVRVLHVPDTMGSTRRCVVLLGGGCCDTSAKPLGMPCLV